MNHNIHNNFNAPDTIVIFSPTFLGDNWTCLEQTSAHQRLPSPSATLHYVGFYDHCGNPEPGWRALILLDIGMEFCCIRFQASSFEDGLGLSVVYSYNLAQNPLFRGLVMNYSTGKWIGVTPTVEGTFPTTHNDGWYGWEAHHLDEFAPLCLDFPDSQLSEGRVYLVPKVHYPMTSQHVGGFNTQGHCWNTGTYWMQTITPWTHFKARTAQ